MYEVYIYSGTHTHTDIQISSFQQQLGYAHQMFLFLHHVLFSSSFVAHFDEFKCRALVRLINFVRNFYHNRYPCRIHPRSYYLSRFFQLEQNTLKPFDVSWLHIFTTLSLTDWNILEFGRHWWMYPFSDNNNI